VWEALVESVRQLPKFEHFLRPIPFGQLRQAIIINASQYGVDALVFGATGPIEHVSLADISLENLTKLSSNIVLEQPVYPTATQQRNYVSRFLKPALRTIWNDIIVHIFEKIHIALTDITVPPRHRVWWYPTGPLTFLPIHAAGPRSEVVDVGQLVISSYVTTLGSLLRSQKKHESRAIKPQPKFLSISQSKTPGEIELTNREGGR
jgi:hypothetical protein